MVESSNPSTATNEAGTQTAATPGRAAGGVPADTHPLRRVLIVDDSSTVRAALREALHDLAAVGEIVEAVDGVDALAQLARTPVDLILSDINMPRLDGFKFLSAVRGNPRLRDILVIMLSALGESVDKVRGLTLGANDYVTKPFERAELLARVTVMLKMQDLQEELRRKAAALERANRELERLANQDGLTGLPNRRSIFARLEIEYDRSRRNDNSLSLLMIDIDHFKNFNDRHGHLAGDEALRAVGTALACGLRCYDCAGRYGGEEFICFLPETAAAEALLVAERLRQRIGSAQLTLTGSDELPLLAGITVSIGVATWPDCPAASLSDLVAAADRALYRAKAGGRNRCVLDDSPQPPAHEVPRPLLTPLEPGDTT